jgi:hypothetical protein
MLCIHFLGIFCFFAVAKIGKKKRRRKAEQRVKRERRNIIKR